MKHIPETVDSIVEKCKRSQDALSCTLASIREKERKAAMQRQMSASFTRLSHA